MTNKYTTCAQASEAAQALGIKSSAEYLARYREDPKLLCNPNKFYVDEWLDWYDFLGTKRPGERYYPTLAEASEAAQALGIKSSVEYRKARYQDSPKLPSNPKRVYADEWVDWYNFLGTKRPGERYYPTLAEASEAAQAL
ncbi:integrase repeat-containing protein, partial [Marinobacter shengliensis]